MRSHRHEVAARYAAQRRLIGSEASGAAATEAALPGLCADPLAQGAILHVTCHGMPPRSEPGDAALLLADVDLEAASLADERIPFAEVVLTACSTGYRPATDWQGIPLSGDDALGLPGAFLEAGAATMLVSIPLAQAGAARRIAVDYHAARLDGLAPLAAFRRAQLALLSDPSVRPRNACGFVLYGCR